MDEKIRQEIEHNAPPATTEEISAEDREFVERMREWSSELYSEARNDVRRLCDLALRPQKVSAAQIRAREYGVALAEIQSELRQHRETIRLLKCDREIADRTLHRDIEEILDRTLGWETVETLNKALRVAYTDIRARLASGPAVEVASGWISVSDRLPERGQVVTVAWNGTTVRPSGYYGDGIWLASGSGIVRDAKVTHWMPLPKPPVASGPKVES